MVKKNRSSRHTFSRQLIIAHCRNEGTYKCSLLLWINLTDLAINVIVLQIFDYGTFSDLEKLSDRASHRKQMLGLYSWELLVEVRQDTDLRYKEESEHLWII